ncbi:MAG: putative ABC exporter domain-containing protein, partial [Thermoguttaceae bacterium]
MDQALIKLLRFRFRGALRRSFRGIKTVRGAIFFMLGLGTLLLWLGPQVMVMFVAGHAPRVDPQMLRDVLPLVLFGVSLMAVLSAARMEGIHFTAAEVDFLFSGPFSRRQLLFYKLSSG